MAEPLIFYFDFSSPYGFLAAREIDALAARHGREVVWKAMLLGVAFKANGVQPLLNVPMKGDYSKRDLLREARRQDLDFRLPPDFPFASISAARAFYWLWDRDPEAAKRLALALMERAFVGGQDIAKAPSVLEVAETQGLDKAEVEAALQDPAVKERLRQEVDTAIQRGVFGSPFVFVGEEPFWGYDHLPVVDDWLKTGGW